MDVKNYDVHTSDIFGLYCYLVVADFPISFSVTSLAQGQSNDCPSASEVTLNIMDKCMTQINQEHGRTIFIFYGQYCTSMWQIASVGVPGGASLFRKLSKIVYCRNRTFYENVKLKLCTCAQSMALGTHTKFQFEILTMNVISGIVYFCKIILEGLWNVGKTPPVVWS